jgi:NTE family protein
MQNVGLVLSGGGARAAYQVGVLSAIADISSDAKVENPFNIYSGVSAGAINTCMLAGSPHTFKGAVENLMSLWTNINSDQVFNSSPFGLTRGALKWFTDLSSGGLKNTHGMSLLQTDPLRQLLETNCKFDEIGKKIKAGTLRAVSVSALDYLTTSTTSFIEGVDDIKTWNRVRRFSEKTNLSAEHIMASAAIPLLFPPIQVGEIYYGDGSVRNLSPCAPAIYLGAKKVIAIGVRKQQDLCYTARTAGPQKSPTLAKVINVLLHAVMMDGLEHDIERMERINQNLKLLTQAEKDSLPVGTIEHLWISPSVEISEIAAKKVHELPMMIRYLLKGLGSLEEAAELASFLLFESNYCKELIEIGYEDGMKAKDKIRSFIT